MSDDDEDMSFSSIHDLDHAPEPPTQHGAAGVIAGAGAVMMIPGNLVLGGSGGGGGGSTTTSPRAHRPSVGQQILPGGVPQRRYSADILPGGAAAGGGGIQGNADMRRTRTSSMNMYLVPQPPSPRDNDFLNNNSMSSSFGSSSLKQGGGFTTPDSHRGRRTVAFSEDERKLMGYGSHDNNNSDSSGIAGEGRAIGTGVDSGMMMMKGGHGDQYSYDPHGGETSNSTNDESRQYHLKQLDSMDDSSVAHDDDDEEQTNASEAGDLGDSERQRRRQAAQRRKPVLFMGFQVPVYCAWRPDLHKIAILVATRAPCFCCIGFRQPTDRAILARLNVLAAVFALVQIASATFLAVVSFAPDLVERTIETETESERLANQHTGSAITNIWNLNGFIYMLAILAAVLFLAAVCTVRVVRNVNLVGAIRYLWLIMWVTPFAFFFVIGLFDYFNVTEVWIKQYWRSAGLAWFRGVFCDPTSTANTLCTVPQSGNETGWCLDNYNSTLCVAIRDRAQASMERNMLAYYYTNAAWGVLTICLLMLVVNTLESLISKPLVQKSRESNVPAWMSLPIVGCIVFGLIFSFSDTSVHGPESGTKTAFIGPFYLCTAGLFFLAAMLGWYISASSIRNARHKRNKIIAIALFVVLMSIIFIMLTTLFGASIAFCTSLAEMEIGDAQRGQIACFIDQSGTCTNCDAASNRCPQWSTEDVTTVIQTSAKGSAALAAIFMLYALSALRFGLGMRRHIRMYQIEYV